MALDASKVLGSPQLAGVKVVPLGRTAKAAGGIAIGGAVSAVMRAPGRGADMTPNCGRLAYLAVTDSELALVRIKIGGRMSEVIKRVPRAQVRSAEYGKGIMAAPLTITFDDGSTWRLETGIRKQAEEVVRALTAS
jgi:hypothetical protein